MLIRDAIDLLRRTCALKHFSFATEKSYTHWLARYGLFLKAPTIAQMPTEKKLEAFLTKLALVGSSASSQNQAFNALLFFYRDVLKQELGPIDSLR